MHPDVIAHYRIGDKLGQGGMGEVYRATDSKLGREVAVKFLPDTMANDATHMARFTREAQVLASLNHPNIASIYGVEDRALIMELVEGQTLSERIKAGPIPLDEALTIARQVADALEAAHAKGIVHRDLKPANIKITPDGVVKVLDFGIAKVAAQAQAHAALEDSPTFATTQAGFILGTAGYMSPEQARGRDVDKRADIWAFGVVLYEMLTGAQLFQGDTVTDVMAAVVRQDPDLSRVPAAVRPLLLRCLEKDPKRRLRDIGDAMLLLDLSKESASAAPVRTAPLRTTPFRLAAAAAVVSLAALAGLAVVHFRETAPAVETVRFPLDFEADLAPIGTLAFAISPDGRNVAYAAYGTDGIPRIWLRPLGALTARALPGSEIARNSQALFWSPDSRFLAYWSDGALRRLDITGGSAQRIADAPMPVFGGSWNRDGNIVFGARGSLMQVAATGGTPTPLTTAAENQFHVLPQFLPDGRHFLYLRGDGGPGMWDVHIGSLDAKPDEQDDVPLFKSQAASAVYSPGPDPEAGQILFLRDNTVLAQPFDARQRQLRGEPATVVENVAGSVSVSNTGTLVYFTVTDPGMQLTWFSRSGQRAGTAGEPGPYNTIKVSPDGSSIAVLRFDEQTNNQDIWQIDPTSGTATRFTFDPAADTQPVWSPDGSRIAWISRRGGFAGFYSKRADGSGSDELLFKLDEGPPPNLTDWTRDGRFLIFNRATDIFAAPVTEGTVADRKPVPLVQAEGVQLGAYVSPDMRWIAYMSNESGRQDMFVQPFAPGASASGERATGKWMLSNGTLGMARWQSDSRELLFLGSDGAVLAVDVAPGPVFKASPPKVLFQLPGAILTRSTNPGAIVDVTRDNQRFMLSMLTAEAGSGMKVVLNWQSDLKTD